MNSTTERHAGGRPRGVKGKDNDGLFKRCPCGRRRWTTCAHAWCYSIGYAKKGHRGTLNKYLGLPRFHPMSRSEAEAVMDKMRVAIREGTYRREPARPNLKPVSVLTFRDVGNACVKEVRNDPNRRSHRAAAFASQHEAICRTPVETPQGVSMPFGELPIAELRTHHIEAFRDGRRRLMQEKEEQRQKRLAQKAEGVPRSALLPTTTETPRSRGGEVGLNRLLEVVRATLNWAILKGYYEHENPFLRHGKRAIKFATERARTRRLQPGEEQRLLKFAAPHLQALILAALETGCRRGELLSLQWRDVLCNDQGEPRTLSLRAENTKTDAARTVPVSPKLRSVLEMRRHAPDGVPHGPHAFVFGNEVGERVGEFKLAWQGACSRAGITGLTFHDLRREHGSRLVEGGVNLLTVSRLLGHRRVSTTDTYLKASEDIAERELQQYHERRNEQSRSN